MQRRHLLLAAAAAPLVAACGGSDDDPNLIGELLLDAELSTLLTAVQTAGLESTLASGGPFTVFAPTNAAFSALLSELGLTQAQLLADTALLTAVLSYHVVAGEVPASAVPAGRAVTPLAGGIFKPEAAGGGLSIVDGRNRVARVVRTDIGASNGIIHKIDRVLLPADKTIVQTAQSLPQFSILVQAVVAAGLVDALSAAGPFTVFAPTDDAFAALLDELDITAEALLADTALLTTVLTYHVLPARVLKAEVPVGTPITTLQGGNFTVNAQLQITDGAGRTANIVATDVLTSNGVIHVIDRVILPAA
jgi:uncharacterized surface protein with fasciclin (FAS1) repeats